MNAARFDDERETLPVVARRFDRRATVNISNPPLESGILRRFS
jgi:hypothetical protein